MITFVVDQKNIGKAQGISAVISNISMVILPWILAKIHDETLTNMHGYFWVEVTMTILAFISLILKIILYRWDKKERGGILNSVDAYELFEEYL